MWKVKKITQMVKHWRIIQGGKKTVSGGSRLLGSKLGDVKKTMCEFIKNFASHRENFHVSCSCFLYQK